MIPDERRTSEPEYVPARDRQFSELAIAERWRLVKEALRDSYPEHLPWFLLKFPNPSSIILCGCSLAITLLMMSSMTIPASKFFVLWFVGHTFFILALTFRALVEEHRYRNSEAEIAHTLSEIEQKILSQRSHE